MIELELLVLALVAFMGLFALDAATPNAPYKAVA